MPIVIYLVLFDEMCFIFFSLILMTGNNGGDTVPSRGPFLPLSLHRWGERCLRVSFLLICTEVFLCVIFPVTHHVDAFVSCALQCMKRRMSCYGAQVHCQRTRSAVSCRMYCHEQQVKNQEVTNWGSMFETMSRSVGYSINSDL